MTLSRAARVFAVLFAGAAPVAASTWIVDDLPGPGVDFTTIADAEAASVAGDVILVRPGSYAGFTVDIGVAILGDPGASITGRVVITSLPQARRATLAGFSMRGLLVQDCAAPVLLEDLVIRPTTTVELGDATAAVRVQGSFDVRFRAIELTPVVQAVANEPIAGVSVSASRVELTGSTVSGARGRSCSNYTYEAPAAQGGHGILANQFGSVRIGGTNVSAVTEGGRHRGRVSATAGFPTQRTPVMACAWSVPPT